MKAKSIITIGEILKQKTENAKANYKDIRVSLEQKYKTEWLDKITKSEKRKLEDAMENYRELHEIYNDFEQHQW